MSPRSTKQGLSRTPSPVRKAPAPRVFAAIDFETADYYRDSACSVAVVRVEDGKIVGQEHHLIRPPRRDFKFTGLHGISWDMVAREPTFDKVWARMQPLLEGVEFLAAHNAPFDRSVLNACCEVTGLEAPDWPFACSVRMSKQVWGLKRATLPDVCAFLDIPLLKHHDAGADAEACARIVLAAVAAGGELP